MSLSLFASRVYLRCLETVKRIFIPGHYSPDTDDHDGLTGGRCGSESWLEAAAAGARRPATCRRTVTGDGLPGQGRPARPGPAHARQGLRRIPYGPGAGHSPSDWHATVRRGRPRLGVAPEPHWQPPARLPSPAFLQLASLEESASLAQSLCGIDPESASLSLSGLPAQQTEFGPVLRPL